MKCDSTQLEFKRYINYYNLKFQFYSLTHEINDSIFFLINIKILFEKTQIFFLIVDKYKEIIVIEIYIPQKN